jgi:hypothetical protein
MPQGVQKGRPPGRSAHGKDIYPYTLHPKRRGLVQGWISKGHQMKRAKRKKYRSNLKGKPSTWIDSLEEEMKCPFWEYKGDYVDTRIEVRALVGAYESQLGKCVTILDTDDNTRVGAITNVDATEFGYHDDVKGVIFEVYFTVQGELCNAAIIILRHHRGTLPTLG